MSDTPFSLDTAPIGLCIVRRDRKTLTILSVNDTFTRWVGTKGETLDEVLTSKEGQEFCKALKSPAPPAAQILPFGYLWVTITVQVDPDTYTLYVSDISQLKQDAEAADATAAQKSNFLATMSHEMRTPMQSVFGLLEMIELEQPASDVLTMVRTAKQSASGLLELLDGILDFAKMDAEQMELDLFEVPVRTLCRGVIEALEVRLLGKELKLIDRVENDVPPVMVGDPKRLRQILINLTGNALKFTKEGTVTIRVSRETKVLPQPSRGFALRFEVIDTGIGMTEEAASRLFKPFAQADNSTSRKYGGTGLGLSICKKLVDLMGGEIGVESEAGKGSTFWFEIPTEEVDVNARVMDLPVLDGISVLSVEDHPQGAREIQKSLRSMGASVEHCHTIADALTLIRRRPFDVGIFDQGLPDGLGVDLVRQTMEIRPFMGLIMYTARDDLGLQHTLNSLGVTYLTKPASRIGLGEAVRDAAAKMHKMTLGDGPTRLVIAEDTASVRDVLKRQLDKLGVDATFVEDGEAALAAVRSGEYGILFTDLHMPKMDGYAVVNAIREDDQSLNRHFPIIALTADVQMAQRQVYMSHGFDECLLKPVSLGHFRRLLIRWGLLKEKQDASQDAAPGTTKTLSTIDMNAVMAQMGAFDQDTIDMLKLFVEMTEPLVQSITEAQQANDYHALQEAAHSLKGAARSACAVHLGDLAARLQDDAEASRPSGPLVADITAAFAAVKAEVSAL